ncbi:ribonuclease H-like domain-containing protein [Tanacetum coccineum]
MITRSQSAIVKPIDRLCQHTFSISHILKNLSHALKDPHWRNAMYDEYNTLVKNSTWLLVARPADVNMVCFMWLFKHKFHANGTLSRYKARLVANDSSQQLGVDFDETFSPVVKPATIHTVLSLVVSRQWPIHQLDVKNVFLNDDLSETVYMHQPLGFVDNRYPHHVFLLQRSLYGLKQAPRAWFQWFAGCATRVGFYHSRCDSSLFIYRQGSLVAYLLIYVDDIILTASCPALLQLIIGSLNNEFDMNDLGALNYFLGISADRTPTESKLGPEGAPVQDPTLYRSLAGGLQYLTFTRPDLSYAVQQICLYMHDPREPHLAALKRILRYVQGCPSIRRSTSATLVYCDNVSAVYMSSNPVQHQRTKHIEIDIHFARDGYRCQGQKLENYEHPSNGSLADHLRSTHNMTCFTWVQRLKICIDIAHGLNYIHTNPEYHTKKTHRTISSSNILLKENWEAVIGGFSKFKQPEIVSYLTTGNWLTDRKLMDIFHFGIVLFEILCWRFVDDPVYKRNNDAGLVSFVRKCFKDGTQSEILDLMLMGEAEKDIFSKGIDQNSLGTFSKIAYQCLGENHYQLRPTAELVLNELKKALYLQVSNI